MRIPIILGVGLVLAGMPVPGFLLCIAGPLVLLVGITMWRDINP